MQHNPLYIQHKTNFRLMSESVKAPTDKFATPYTFLSPSPFGFVTSFHIIVGSIVKFVRLCV